MDQTNLLSLDDDLSITLGSGTDEEVTVRNFVLKTTTSAQSALLLYASAKGLSAIVNEQMKSSTCFNEYDIDDAIAVAVMCQHAGVLRELSIHPRVETSRLRDFGTECECVKERGDAKRVRDARGIFELLLHPLPPPDAGVWRYAIRNPCVFSAPCLERILLRVRGRISPQDVTYGFHNLRRSLGCNKYGLPNLIRRVPIACGRVIDAFREAGLVWDEGAQWTCITFLYCGLVGTTSGYGMCAYLLRNMDRDGPRGHLLKVMNLRMSDARGRYPRFHGDDKNEKTLMRTQTMIYENSTEEERVRLMEVYASSAFPHVKDNYELNREYRERCIENSMRVGGTAYLRASRRFHDAL